MHLFRDDAIVLRTRTPGEADRIVPGLPAGRRPRSGTRGGVR